MGSAVAPVRPVLSDEELDLVSGGGVIIDLAIAKVAFVASRVGPI